MAVVYLKDNVRSCWVVVCGGRVWGCWEFVGVEVGFGRGVFGIWGWCVWEFVGAGACLVLIK